MSTPAFTFKSAVSTTRGNLASGETQYELFHPLLPTTLLGTAGFLLVLNGWNLNRFQTDTTGYDGTTSTALQMLQMRAPRTIILPMISWEGEGRVFRPGAKWRYRWYDSRTGQYSGLSPLSPTETYMGVETVTGSTTTLGQTAWFYIATSDKPANADTIQLFANTASEDDVWYLADEQPTGSSSYVLLTDNNTDDELVNQIAVVVGVPSAVPVGPSWAEGVMPPVAKAWIDPFGRVFYYGIYRQGRFYNPNITAAVSEGSDLVTTSGTYTTRVEPGRVGQRVKFYTTNALSTPIQDPTVYRLVKVESSTTFRVWPDLQVSGSLSAGGTGNWFFEIVDDRDERATFMSEPGIPWLIDNLKTVFPGQDYDDGTLHWFSLGTRTFCQTKRRLYEAVNASTEDPSRSMMFMVKANEGSVGLWAGCVTPFGWVYVHETEGVRLFDGERVYPLGRTADPFQEFLPRTQFNVFDQASLSEVRCWYDYENQGVIVSFIPTGVSTLSNTLFYSTPERDWRGPHRERVFSAGRIRTTTSSDRFITGDDFGSLLVREEQAKDFLPTITNSSTGTITGVTGTRFVTDSTQSWDADGDTRLRGAPIWFTTADGTTNYFARIAGIVSSTQIELDGPPVSEDGSAAVPATGWTYKIGAIRWSITTAYIDEEGDPARPHEFFYLNLRFKRGASSETFEAAGSEDGSGSWYGERVAAGSESAPTKDVNGVVFAIMRFKREGSLIQVRVRGLASNGEPKITRAVLIAESRDGAQYQT